MTGNVQLLEESNEDAFGQLEIEVIRDPERHLDEPSGELTQQELEEGARVAQEAFTRNPPTDQDVYDHMLADTLVLAYVDDELVGFSGTDYLEEENIALGSGLAVDPEYQQNGIGSLIRTRGIKEDLGGSSRPQIPFLRDRPRSGEDEGYFAARSANPAILSHMQEQYGAFPREERETPSDVETAMERAAEALDPDSEFNPPVMKEAYPGQMNDMPEHEKADFLRDIMEEKGSGYDEGDALIMAARMDDVGRVYDELLQATDYSVREKVV